MPVTIPKTWSADEDFLADDINANFTNIKNKFSTTAGVGIDDGDIASNADINANKLSTSSGKQIKEDRLENNCVTAEKLRSDAAVDGNRAVTTLHIRNQAVEKEKVKLGSLTKAQTAINSQSMSASTGAVGNRVFLAAHIDVVNNAGNYRVQVQVTSRNRALVGTDASAWIVDAYNLDPATPVAVASNFVVGAYFTSIAGLAGNSLSFTVAMVYIPNS